MTLANAVNVVDAEDSLVRPASPRILIVEDEAVVAMDLESQLRGMNYNVCAIVDNGMDAIARAWEMHPDLILMDIVIKGTPDGVDAARHIARGLHIPVVFLTAYSDEKTIERAARTAPHGYLTKPYQLRELHAIIEVALFKGMLERRLRDSERWFASTLRCVADGVIATDSAGKIRFMNTVAENLSGWRLEEVTGRDLGEVVSMKDSRIGAWIELPTRLALRQDNAVGIDFGTLLYGREGKSVPVDDSAAPIRDEEGKILGAVLVFRDVRERMLAEENLRQSEERFRNAFDFAPVGMALLGLDNHFLQVNHSICAVLGYSATELLGAEQARFSDNRDLPHERDALYELLSGHSASVQFEKRYRSKSGEQIWTLANVSLLRKNGEPFCYLYQIHDLTERKDAEFRLARLAHFDPLTGLANRAWLSDEIERQIVLARRHRRRFAVVFLDLDHFKQVNDSLGHQAGDELLQIIATKLKNAIRETDSVARLGGDEFVILLPEIRSEDEVLFVTQKIQMECARPVQVAGQEISTGLSLGVSIFPDDAQDARTLLRYADSALYYAKAEGRNNLQFYHPELTARVEKKMKLGIGLRFALERHELSLHYQPIVSLSDGSLTATEALIRWRHPTLGLLSPDSFIPIAEETGLSVPIGEWVIHEACQEAANWPPDTAGSIFVSVNVSPRQFKAGNLVGIVKHALEATGLNPARLCIEITEQLLMENTEQNLMTIAELKDLGVRIAIDDFGVGYSSLSYISRFNPMELKIDISLVRNVITDRNNAAIVRAAIAMAHSLQISVVTEGVETTEQKTFLEEEGCDLAQGFLFHHPYTSTEFSEKLKHADGKAASF